MGRFDHTDDEFTERINPWVPPVFTMEWIEMQPTARDMDYATFAEMYREAAEAAVITNPCMEISLATPRSCTLANGEF